MQLLSMWESAMLSELRCFWTIVAAVTVGLLMGCSGSGNGIANPDSTLAVNEDSAAFLDRISSQDKVSENDAMRGILLLLDGKDTVRTFKQRVEILLDRKIVDAKWGHDASRTLTRGKLAYMIYQATKIPGGVMLWLTGPSQRYCLRELQYRKIMTKGSFFVRVTGMEFVGVLGRADICIRTGKIPDMVGETASE